MKLFTTISAIVCVLLLSSASAERVHAQISCGWSCENGAPACKDPRGASHSWIGNCNGGGTGLCVEECIGGPITTNNCGVAIQCSSATKRTSGCCNAGPPATLTPTSTPIQPRPGDPSDLDFSCHNPGTSVTITWNASSPAADFYSLRVDNTADGWDGSCSSPSGDFCVDVRGQTSYTFTVDPTAQYNWWIHARTDADPHFWGPAGGVYGPLVSCAPNCSNVAVTVGGEARTVMSVGEVALVSAQFESLDGDATGDGVNDLRAELFQDEFTRTIASSLLPGTSGSLSGSWIAPAPGQYAIRCRAWNDAVAECRPPSMSTTSPVYACKGPVSEVVVTVEGEPTIVTPTIVTPTNPPPTPTSVPCGGLCTTTSECISGAVCNAINICDTDPGCAGPGCACGGITSTPTPGPSSIPLRSHLYCPR